MLSGNLGTPDVEAAVQFVREKDFLILYTEWLKSWLNVEQVYDNLLFDTLFDIPFRAVVPEDERRMSDALELRERFSQATCVFLNPSTGEGFTKPCTALEVVVSLAIEMDYQATELPFDESEKNVPWLYRLLLKNLSIDHEIEGATWEQNERMIRKVVNKWLDRRYSKNGRGGLFPLKRTHRDQRKVELWNQMNEYIMENFYNSNGWF